MQKKTKNLLKTTKKILNPNTIKKIRSIEDESEQLDATKYAIISQLKLKQHEIESLISQAEKQNLNMVYAKVKAARIPAKIRNFQMDYDNNEFYKLQNLFNDIQNEVNNARPVW